MLPRVTKAIPKDSYIVALEFSNGEKRNFSVTPFLNYPVYMPLKDNKLFNSVYIQNGTICWGDDDVIDFDPDRVYLESV